MASKGGELHARCLDTIDPYRFFDFRPCFGHVVDPDVKDFGLNNITGLISSWCREPTEVTNTFLG